MPVMVDGNNVLHALRPSIQRRSELRRLTLELARREGIQIILVFDGPPPQSCRERENLGRVTVIYAVASTADDVIVTRLPDGAPAKNWVVVTDDRALGDRVRQQGAAVRSVAEWRTKLIVPQQEKAPETPLSPEEVAEWERFFSGGSRDPK